MVESRGAASAGVRYVQKPLQCGRAMLHTLQMLNRLEQEVP